MPSLKNFKIDNLNKQEDEKKHKDKNRVIFSIVALVAFMSVFYYFSYVKDNQKIRLTKEQQEIVDSFSINNSQQANIIENEDITGSFQEKNKEAISTKKDKNKKTEEVDNTLLINSFAN